MQGNAAQRRTRLQHASDSILFYRIRTEPGLPCSVLQLAFLSGRVCDVTYVLFIALDPARPLIRAANRLRSVDASIVQVIHTNAGQFGEGGRLGVIDFCVNGGREQPTCENKTLCTWGIPRIGNAQRLNGPRLEWSVGPCTLQVYESCNNAKLRFLLYNKGEEPVQLQAHNPQPPSGKFNPKLPTKVVIHGYAGHAEFNTTAVIRRGTRICRLDPALPLFATLNDKWKLDAEDADFVDAVHTNAGVFGKVEALGNVDFFMNGGSIQPACAGHRNVPLCSHLLAPVYFAESINTDIGFWGAPCPSIWYLLMGWCADKDISEERKILMGEHCDTGNRGIFYLDTSDTPPYALGKIRHTKRRRYSQANTDKKQSSSDICLSEILYF
ncbi:hypothetical protein C0J52_19494 [Blattella germanica]|nr:hypothetical protein C0J52_19494 [Blattella germanica]